MPELAEAIRCNREDLRREILVALLGSQQAIAPPASPRDPAKGRLYAEVTIVAAMLRAGLRISDCLPEFDLAMTRAEPRLA